jgi:HlyD family secretion protein
MNMECGGNISPRSAQVNNEKKKRGVSPSGWVFWILVAALILTGTGGALLFLLSGQNDQSFDAPTFTAVRGPITISISESGTIKAREQVILKSEVEGVTTILSLVSEGTRVKKGDLLIELDASTLKDDMVNEQILVMNAEAAYIRARENLEVTKNQAKSDIDQAELNLRFAKEDFTKYVEGEYPKELKEARSRITIADEELQRASEKRTWSEVLYEEKYLSLTELQADQLAAKKAELELELAQEELALLENYTYKRRIAELESDITQAEMALERAKLKASADIVQAEADLRAKLSEYQRQKGKLEKIEGQIRKTGIYAPADGLVVYATSAKADWRGNREPLAEGQEVRERQELIYLPTGSSFIAEVKVHESSLEKIRLDLPVVLSVDALPGKPFTGRVSKIAPLPDAVSVWLNPDLKLYNTEIVIENGSKELRTGMSCRAEIIVERIDNAVYIPVQAVLTINGRPQVFVQNGGTAEPRPVKTGPDNNRMIVIEHGINPGENVLLTPPLEEATVAEGGEEKREDQEQSIKRVSRDSAGRAAAAAQEAQSP